MYKSRIFSDHKDSSCNHYIINKRRVAMTHPEIQKKILINNYYATYSCDKAPMKIVDFPTSYTCNNNKHNLSVCKNVKNILYPYGYYMCRNESCNTCTNIGQTLNGNSVDPSSNAKLSNNSYKIHDLYATEP